MINVRVYGVLINEKKQVLVSDELIRGQYITKFCGGGLEHGEGTRDCLRREFMEEMNLRIEPAEHLYTTDFYQPSAFRAGDQILAVYYFVRPLEEIKTALRAAPFQFDEKEMATYRQSGETETFRFIDADKFSANDLTLPIDKIVAEKIVASLRS